MNSVSLPKAIEILNFDGTGSKTIYPKKNKRITFGSWLHTQLMEDAGHNPRIVGTVVRTILNGYYNGRIGTSGRGVGISTIREQLKQTRFEASEEGKKAMKQKRNLISEVTKEIKDKRIEAEPIVYDLSRYDILEEKM